MSLTDELGRVTRYAYDAMNRLVGTAEPDPDGGGPLQAPVTQRTYDANGNLTSVTDARGAVTAYTYDQRSRLLTTTDANGGVTRNIYGSDEKVAAVIDALGHRTDYTYDLRHRLIKTVDALGGVTRYRLRRTTAARDRRHRRERQRDRLRIRRARRLLATTDAYGHTRTYASTTPRTTSSRLTDEAGRTTAFATTR